MLDETLFKVLDFATTWDNFVYFDVKGIGAKFHFRLNSRVSGRNQIEYANKGA